MHIKLEAAADSLINGDVVAVPTETVYGLAASLGQLDAIHRIFALKGRPINNPLIIHVAGVDQIVPYALSLPPDFNKLAHAFWPGPMTLIVPIRQDLIYPVVRAHLDTAGFRIPSHPLARQLLAKTGPLVMPSANLSGKPSATSREHVEEDFGFDFPVLDGGRCQKGIESTILCYQNHRWIIVRLGALSSQDFVPILGYEPLIAENENNKSKPICPGQLYRHYAPQAILILKQDGEDRENAPFILGFKERSYPKEKRVLWMGSLDNPYEVAENLYGVLRQLDREQAHLAWVDMDFPADGLWVTIRERLMRAGEK